MKKTRKANLSLLPIALLAIGAHSNAEIVTWEVSGTLTAVNTTGGFITEFPSAVVGSPFTLYFSFESTSTVSDTRNGATGIRYRYFSALESVQLTINGESLDRSQQGFQSIDIWDDFSFSSGGNSAADGFNVIWGVDSPQGDFAQLGLILRGGDDLTVFNGPGLPSEPPDGLTSFSTQVVQLIDGTDEIVGAVSSISIRLPRFADVPKEYWAYEFIELLASSNITSGCGNDNYCPTSQVTRAQMAVFLERGINGSDFIPPAATGNAFLDVGVDDFAASFIEQLASDGITAGCGNNNFCPDEEVKRDQMAVFLLRAKYGAGYLPPTATGVFGDVDLSYWAVDWIEQLAVEGITAGCGDGNYCPEAPVNRAQMAVFLVRTFGL